MNPPFRSAVAAGLAVCGLTALGAHPLVAAWRHSPYDTWGWVALLLWFAPLLRWRGELAAGWSYAGLALGLLGQLVELNALKYAAFATAVAAFGPARRWQGWAWWLCAAAWFPVLGWMLAPYLSAAVVPWLRLGLALLGAAAAWSVPRAAVRREPVP